MATPIKAVPILSGNIADDFVRQAQERENNPSPNLTFAQEAHIAEVMRQMREFKFPWDRV